MKSLILITGGARSGKSRFAEELATARQCEVLFTATAEPRDADMSARIAQHQAERPAHWRTLEEPLHVAQALANAAPAPLVLLDCVTLWVTNLLLAEQSSWERAQAELDALLAWYRAQPAEMELIIVTNEVGLGIVPADQVSRTFRDWLGRFNQRLAAEADIVYLLVSGLAVDVKALAAPASVLPEQ
jgi:adenosylcobinamide kinase/adenosylcobinamide-phosphate guanylyltransferase